MSLIDESTGRTTGIFIDFEDHVADWEDDGDADEDWFDDQDELEELR